MSLVISKVFTYDTDAGNYIQAVEAADGEALETETRYAINDFVIGCKQDGIWNAIKASCILAGARTLAGALVPLVGTAPTNVNFVSGDYDRATGLVGNAVNKTLNSNYVVPSGLQNNAHGSVWISYMPSLYGYISMGVADGSIFGNYPSTANVYVFACNSASASSFSSTGIGASLNLVGQSRSSASQINFRVNNVTSTVSSASITPSANAVRIFSGVGSPAYNSPGRFAFYSIGESLDLTLLDTRVTALMTAFVGAIP